MTENQEYLTALSTYTKTFSKSFPLNKDLIVKINDNFNQLEKIILNSL